MIIKCAVSIKYYVQLNNKISCEFYVIHSECILILFKYYYHINIKFIVYYNTY